MAKTTPVNTMKLIHQVARLTRQVESIKTWTELHRADAKMRLFLDLELIHEDTAGDLNDEIARADKRMKDEAKADEGSDS